MENIKDDLSGFCMELFSGLGGLCFFVGTILFTQANNMDSPAYLPAVILYTIGGLLFFLAAVLVQRRYFFQSSDGYAAFR